ncbi:sugar ABC transporter substrate-binding protein [Arthrobacter sp. GN70]|uniref:Sugar ABC transporter substrate-binding protein n=2 Tax=Arthrobacter TaxID=1663 RepID=A0A4R5KDV9_9MICC|nr:sugar ABC transporter substrate-binding protein [Arthrobacter sp. GN70]TDF93423.1 sugar ABC transporter substrate-binding protein [Arthrobacter terricola]
MLGGAMAAAVVLALAACGSGTSTAGSTTEDGAQASAMASASGNITFWSSVANMKPVVDAFNQSHPNIKVNYEVTPSAAPGYAKLSTALQAGNAPDVATIEYYRLPGYASNGDLQPISDYIGQADLGKFSGQVRGLVSLGGKSWALPYDAPPMVFYYRKDLLADAGVSTAPATWQEFEADARKLKSVHPDAYLASFYPDDPSTFAGLAWQAGAKWFSTEGDSWNVNLGDAATQKVAGFWQKLIDDKLVKVEQSFSDQWSQDLQKSTMAGVVGASWSATGIVSRTKGQEGKWAVAELPNWGTPADSMLGGSTFAITKTSKNPAAAAAFIQWMTTSPDAIKARGNVGSAWLAYPGLSDIAKANFSTAPFGGQDIFSVFQKASSTVSDGWNWGPKITATYTPLADGFGRLATGGTISEAINSAQTATVSDLKNSGLSVKG